MPENPLLPHRTLSELYRRVLDCRELERQLTRRRGANFGVREALLAATSMQLVPGDLLCGESDDHSAEALAPIGKDGVTSGWLAVPVKERLAGCVGAACGVTASATNGLVLAFTRSGLPEPGWPDAVTWALEQRLPIVLVCEDAAGGGNAANGKAVALSWTAMQALAKRKRMQTTLPILAVDGADAVAIYRVMQESAIRARIGDGPTVIWAVTSPKSAKVAHAHRPLGRLCSYLEARGIPRPE